MHSTKALLLRHFSRSIHQPFLERQKTIKLLDSLTAAYRKEMARQAIDSSIALTTHFDTILKNPVINSRIASRANTLRLASHQLPALIHVSGPLVVHGQLDIEALKACIHTLSTHSSSPLNQPAHVAASLRQVIELVASPMGIVHIETLSRGLIPGLLRALVRHDQHQVVLEAISNNPQFRHSLFPHYLNACSRSKEMVFLFTAAQQIILNVDRRSTAIGLLVLMDHYLLFVQPCHYKPMGQQQSSIPNASIPLHAYQDILKASEEIALSSPGIRNRLIHAVFALLYPEPKFRNPNLALSFLERLRSYDIERFDIKRKTHVLRLALTLAQILIQRESFADATWVLRFLETNFSSSLSLPATHVNEAQPPSPQEEAMVLQNLDALLGLEHN